MIYDRSTKELIKDNSYGAGQIKWLYTTHVGRLLLRIIILPIFSRVYGLYSKSRLSFGKIAKIEQKYKIDQSEYNSFEFKSFNDFFVRQLKPESRPISSDSTDLMSPADAKVLYYKISEKLTLDIKHSKYAISDLLGSKQLTADYAGGDCLVFRLSLEDCHRYIFIDDGEVVSKKTIKGVLHTVQPLSHQSHKPFIQNYREVTELTTSNFGPIMVIEIGALLVGKIINSDRRQFLRGQEKGYFDLGGSTIVILLKPKVVVIDKDIKYNSSKGIETKVKQGEAIGKIK